VTLNEAVRVTWLFLPRGLLDRLVIIYVIILVIFVHDLNQLLHDSFLDLFGVHLA
jgi:hypothetical protein